MYWTVVGALTGAEGAVGWIVGWVPFYSEIKLGVMLWMVAPQTEVSLEPEQAGQRDRGGEDEEERGRRKGGRGAGSSRLGCWPLGSRRDHFVS